MNNSIPGGCTFNECSDATGAGHLLLVLFNALLQVDVIPLLGLLKLAIEVGRDNACVRHVGVVWFIWDLLVVDIYLHALDLLIALETVGLARALGGDLLVVTALTLLLRESFTADNLVLLQLRGSSA